MASSSCWGTAGREIPLLDVQRPLCHRAVLRIAIASRRSSHGKRSRRSRPRAFHRELTAATVSEVSGTEKKKNDESRDDFKGGGQVEGVKRNCALVL